MPQRSGRGGRGLRARLVIGFVGVALATAVVTAAAAVIGALIVFGTHQIGTARVVAEVYDVLPLRSGSDTTVVAILVVAALGLLALAVGSALLVARRMLEPVRDLAAAAERVAAGDLAVRLEPTGDDELAGLADGFNAMTVNLGRSMDELRRLEAQARRFAADVAHELRSPLSAMTAVTGILEGGPAGGRAGGPDGADVDSEARARRLVVQEIAHLDRLVTDLIEMSRFDAGTVRLDTDVVHLAGAVHACLAMRGWDTAVATRVPDDLRTVLDRRRFDVILANLVGNAVKYGRPPITVTAAGPIARHGRSWLRLTVTDHGPGLAEAALPHVFDRFYKADAARARSDGSGLGLAIAMENARLHGGTITAGNGPAGGAVFSLLLPMQMPARADQPCAVSVSR